MKTVPFFLLALLLLSACTEQVPDDESDAAVPTEATTLKDAFGDAFLVGAALNTAQVTGRDTMGAALVAAHFNSTTPENVMKWGPIHPSPDSFAFDAADAFVEFSETHGMFMVGHTLVWHSQTPRWVFEDEDGNPLTREALLERMKNHIETVVGRYQGRVHGWDVVNEALNEDGTLRESPWLRIIGEDYIARAFEYAHAADPDAELYYNDYSLENEAKRNGAVRLVASLQEQGVPVHGIGTQGHYSMSFPTMAQLDSTIQAFADLDVKVMITELDIAVLPRERMNPSADVSERQAFEARMNPYTEGLPDSVQQALAQRYADLFGRFIAHADVIDRVTFWGVTDGDSWLNNWPIPGRTTYPLLFDRDWQPKAAFHAVMETRP